MPAPLLSGVFTKKVLKSYKLKVVGGRTSRGFSSFFFGFSSSSSSFYSFFATGAFTGSFFSSALS